MDKVVNIVGAGLSGLAAAMTLAKENINVRLISAQVSERAQSNLAEGGINAALDVMGEDDDDLQHYQDTMKGGCYLADPNMVMNLVKNAPAVIGMLEDLGVPFHRMDGHIAQRNFGGQKKKRTCYAKSTTGKVIMTSLIDEVRKYEATGTITRLPHHQFERLIIVDSKCVGVRVIDDYTRNTQAYYGPVIMAVGGMNGIFYGNTTGTTANTGSAAATLFYQGVEFANLEFIQYHPTTSPINAKRLLISEAARGEGARIFYYNADGSKNYFMEEKYGDHGNLMPRDVVTREIIATGQQAYLDFDNVSDYKWQHILSDMREEIISYLKLDPKSAPIPISPGIHYFMGGIRIDENHHTNIENLYAAGECACGYHGANRLGGNSMLGAIYGGMRTAKCLMEDGVEDNVENGAANDLKSDVFSFCLEEELWIERELERELIHSLGTIRNGDDINVSIKRVDALITAATSDEMMARLYLGKAFLISALYRKESRGAHVRADYPDTDDNYKKTSVASFDNGDINISYADIPKARFKESIE